MGLTQLLNLPRLREIGDSAQEIIDKCNELQDLLARYEDSFDMDKAERAEERESVRQEVAVAMDEIVSDMRVFSDLHARLHADPPA